jgi:hypothetical protein
VHNVPLDCNPKLMLLYYVQVLCQNEIHIDTVCEDVRYLCEKWLCEKRGFWHKFQNVKFEVPIAMSLKIQVFWDVVLCQLVSS